MFAGQFVLNVWTGSEHACFAVLKNFLPIQSFEIFFEVLALETDSTISSLGFFKNLLYK